MNSSLHTIRKQTLQFQYNGNADGFALQKDVSDWCNFNLIPAIEQQLDLLDFGDNFLTIDKLKIEATANKNDWQQKIRDELIFSLKQKLINYKPKFKEEPDNKRASRARKLDELILYYFENGFLPWWGLALIADDFDAVLQNWVTEEMSPARIDFIVKELKQKASKTLVERILTQVRQDFFFQFLKNIYKQEVEMISHTESFIKEVIVSHSSTAQQKAISLAVYRFLLTMMIENEGIINTDILLQYIFGEVRQTKIASKLLKPTFERIDKTANPVKMAWQQLLEKEIKKQVSGGKKFQLSVDKTITKTELNPEEKEITDIAKDEKRLQYNKLIDRLTNKESVKQSQNDRVAELQEGIYIDNSGAVIFAAFLPALFKQLKLENDGVLQNTDLAAMLIQYCVTGNAKIAEYELVLPKIMCGIDIEFPVNTKIKISTSQMKEVDDLLLALIEHWSVLKNTSVDGLRESFLKRSGKLSIENNNWLLQIEQRPYDMLLQQLPWGISMIKLPWMKKLLITEWV